MPKKVNRYKILLSTPSDISKEISIVKSIIEEWNVINSDDKNTTLQLIHWSLNTYPEMGDHPQAIINKQIVKDCDIVVGILWSRFGTPTTNYGSGTEEEIMESIILDKHVMIYFCNKTIPSNKYMISQARKIKKFRNNIKNSGLHSYYKNNKNFEELFRRHLFLLMNKIIKK